ncbi:cytochrome P450 4V2-like [Mercenaria mercenaria]|uniref:cytochrome P450 4V2-like n=1 Tax=Mercenaria mercenaria TaxID=6596 RepID=UPI00234F7045|nr:cytochrome P450 4V2-like [Mercenaria mercenaria]
MVAVSLLLTGVFVSLFTFLLYRLEKIRRNVDRLGGPRSLPILGNVHQLKRSPKDFTEQFLSLFEEFSYQPVLRLLFGWHPMIFVCSPEEAEPLLNSSKHMDKSSDYRFMYPWLGTGLLTSTGEKWKSRRKLLTPSFHFKILHDFVGVFNEQAKILLEKMLLQADGKTTVNMLDDITLCALDIICETAMGRSVNAQRDSNSEYVQAVCKVAEYTILRARSPWLWPEILFSLIGPGKDYKRCLSILHGFTEEVIQERQAEILKKCDFENTRPELLEERENGTTLGCKKRLAFLDMLLCATAGPQKMTYQDIREEVDTFMFEGHDTTATAASWALHFIGADPDVQRKVHDEMDKIFGDSDRDATMDDLKEMKYLECCIKESLRIFPSVALFGRSLTEDTLIGGVNIQKDTTVVIVPIAIHRNKNIYPDPMKFDPDRFLPENSVSRHPFAFIPFSAGGRNCIGQKFAILEEKVLLTTIFRNFSVKSMQKREELCPILELMLKPGKGIEVILTKRSTESVI